MLYAQYSGVDVRALFGEATAWVAQRIPLQEGASREELMRKNHALPWPEDEMGDEGGDESRAGS